MTGDLVERLRKARVWPDNSQSRVTIETAHKAADRIEALEAENERLRVALELIRDPNNVYYAGEMRAFARAALGDTE